MSPNNGVQATGKKPPAPDARRYALSGVAMPATFKTLTRIFGRWRGILSGFYRSEANMAVVRTGESRSSTILPVTESRFCLVAKARSVGKLWQKSCLERERRDSNRLLPFNP